MQNMAIDKDLFFPQNISKTLKRIAIFASYNVKGCISDYVVYYLRELKKVVDVIIFVADNQINPEEIEKIKDFVAVASFKKHNCYDFGSYKKGYELAKKENLLNLAEELILCNDSCYGPIFPFSEVFNTMEKEDVDFWGMARSLQVKEHLQSYFILFKKKVFISQTFMDFINSVVHQNNQYEYVLKYEVNLAAVLQKAGFKYSSYLDVKGKNYPEALQRIGWENPTTYPLTLHKLRIPLIKKKAFLADFSSKLHESIMEEHKTIECVNSELYDYICRNIKEQYYEQPHAYADWVALAKNYTEVDKILPVLDKENTHKAEIIEELEEQMKREKDQFYKMQAAKEENIQILNQKLKDANERNTSLQKEIMVLQQEIEAQRRQLSHRSVKKALAIEKQIDKINKTFHWGKYSKKRIGTQSILSDNPSEEPMAQLSYDSWYETNIDYSDFCTDIKAIALYLPQFHEFKENNEWWGKGFTEWTNTKKAVPRFISHYQPREPHEDFGYYDLSDWKVLDKQAKLAKQHGIYGFCFYRYWFSGKTLMEKPLELLLEHPEIDLNYCLCWANENWTRKWDGNNSEILIGQSYENDSLQYIIDIEKFLRDPRYIRVNGKPVIIIYRPNLLPNAAETFRKWKEWAKNNGIGDILIWIQRGCATIGISEIVENADGEIEFPPSGTADFDNYDITKLGVPSETGNLIGYRKLVKNIIAGKGSVETFSHKTYRGITLGWDNSPRRKEGFWATWGFSLYDYYNWFRYIIQYTRQKHDPEERFIFINAWNEWAEGTYLEPDKRFGYSSINVTARALFDLPLNPRIDGTPFECVDENEVKKAENLISRNIPLFPYSIYAMYHEGIDAYPAATWEACNALKNPNEELKKIRQTFLNDEKKTFEKLSLKRIVLEEVPLRPINATDKKIAVHLHLFYVDMVPFMVNYLNNIPETFDLFVSVPETMNCNPDILKKDFTKIRKVDNIVIKLCPNRGRDIAPMICLFGKELQTYDYIAHLHSKKSLHTPSHNVWAKYIFDHLLGSQENVSRIFNLLDENIGVISPPDFLMMPEQPSGWGSNMQLAQDMLNKSGLKIDLKKVFPIIEFPQGSMFWAKTSYLQQMFTLPIDFKDFPEEPIGQDGTIAHALERLFFVWGMNLGMETRQIYLNSEKYNINTLR